MKALIDGDVILYGCGFAAQQKIYTVTEPDGTQNEFQYKKDATLPVSYTHLTLPTSDLV